MFGFSKKERAAKSLERVTKAIMEGIFFHINEAENYELNEEASAWLYTEAQALQIYILIVIFNNTFGRTCSWATPQFSAKTISCALMDLEIQQGLVPGATSTFIFKRCAEIDSMPREKRGEGQQFVTSGKRIAELDPSANVGELAELFENLSKTVFDRILPIFEER